MPRILAYSGLGGSLETSRRCALLAERRSPLLHRSWVSTFRAIGGLHGTNAAPIKPEHSNHRHARPIECAK